MHTFLQTWLGKACLGIAGLVAILILAGLIILVVGLWQHHQGSKEWRDL